MSLKWKTNTSNVQFYVHELGLHHKSPIPFLNADLYGNPSRKLDLLGSSHQVPFCGIEGSFLSHADRLGQKNSGGRSSPARFLTRPDADLAVSSFWDLSAKGTLRM